MTAGAVMDVPVIMGVCIRALIGTIQVGRLMHLTHLDPPLTLFRQGGGGFSNPPSGKIVITPTSKEL